jgi:chromosome segregation protein
VQFSKLRLTGFKSFVDPTELDIQPGMTGVVGPNGCGKSNLVEALKWVMGETSAKQMRGSEMDDVIFAGSRNRPARNIAEVGLALDNSERGAPSQFNDADDLEVTRKIEREKGSTYRVNAKEVRARDVHLLFADAASGARSTALVSQGHIGEVVSAKPAQRRKLLEEAAGISGLHSRRHEAELRLRGAETNLERLDDIMVTLEAQMLSLRKQVRQATRYRNLNDHIRKAEATLFLIRWTAASLEMERSKELLGAAEMAVTEMTSTASAASVAQAAAATHLPELREKEAEAAAALQRLTLAKESLEEEEARLAAQQEEVETRLVQVTQDIERERELAADANAAIRTLDEEKQRISGTEEGQEAAISEAGEKLSTIKGQYDEQENTLGELTQQVAGQEAQRNDLERRRTELESRLTRLRASNEELKAEIVKLEEEAIDRDAVAAAEAKLANSTNALEQSRNQVEAAEQARIETTRRLSETQAQSQETLAATAKLEAEVSALAELLETGDPDLWPPLIDAVTVEPGLESALGTALGDDLSAATDESAPVHWRHLPTSGGSPALPLGAEPLSNFVKGPGALISRLSQIGVVADSETGWRLLPDLKQGQRLVTRDGAFWRWDGLSSAAEAPTSAAIRLQQRNRLENTRKNLESARTDAAAANANVDAAREAVETTTQNEQTARGAVREAETHRETAQNEMAQLQRQTSENDSKLTARRDTAYRVAADLAEAEESLKDVAEAEANLTDLEEGRRQVNSLRAVVGEKRGELVEAQSAFDTLRNQAEERSNRLQAIASQMTNWNTRKEDAGKQLEERTERKKTLEAERERLAQQPDEIKRRHQEILDKVEEAEAKRKDAADRLAESETKLADADRNLREAEGKLANVREQRVRAESAVEQADQATAALIERMEDHLDCGPGHLRELSGLDEEAELPDLEGAEKRVDRLVRERENMGPVNLLAEAEATELGEQIETLTSEREDLISAIGKLRRGINELNREGRQRLLESFEQVNKHFQGLFVRLFGGGRAHLELVESDDPLEAGLEIMASPPGKRLQVLSLLSGGEQALTALSLLFAVFMCNPAPICVLDEVDAPLDDANVDRFCTMVDEMAHSLSTRFLVITHHRMTMARMDRLFGVTMGEQGVSQLVSVDLGQAIELRDIA